MSFATLRARQHLYDILPSIDSRLDIEIQSISSTSIAWTDGSKTPLWTGSIVSFDMSTHCDPPRLWTRNVRHRNVPERKGAGSPEPMTKAGIRKASSKNVFSRIRQWYRKHADADRIGYLEAIRRPQGTCHFCQSCCDNHTRRRLHGRS